MVQKAGLCEVQRSVTCRKVPGGCFVTFILLGFPDAITYGIVTDRKMTRLHRSPAALLTRAAYRFAYRVNAPYSHASILNHVKSVLKKIQPQTTFVTLRKDTNPDHTASHIYYRASCKPIRDSSRHLLKNASHNVNYVQQKWRFQ
jgi:LmbE family N-acetylglucosaminyl deacetylase